MVAKASAEKFLGEGGNKKRPKIASISLPLLSQYHIWKSMGPRLFTYNCSSQLREHKQKLHITYLTSWHNNILGYKLWTD